VIDRRAKANGIGNQVRQLALIGDMQREFFTWSAHLTEGEPSYGFISVIKALKLIMRPISA